MARILCGSLLLFALAAGTLDAAPSTLDVQGRSYVVVGACDQPAYSIRLPLGPPPGRDSMDGLSVLFGADAAGHLAAMFQRSVATLRMILAASGIQPVMTLNEVPYFDGHALIAIARALREGADDA